MASARSPRASGPGTAIVITTSLGDPPRATQGLRPCSWRMMQLSKKTDRAYFRPRGLPMPDDAAYQSLRGFIARLEREHPTEVVRIAEPVDLAYQMQALALELERRRRFPVLIFEQVRGHTMPVVSNVMASRTGLALALGIADTELPETYAARLKEP